jgi:hypothetical protein
MGATVPKDGPLALAPDHRLNRIHSFLLTPDLLFTK